MNAEPVLPNQPWSPDNRRSSPSLEMLAPIWRRVLRRPSIGIHEDFFDVGGDPSLARELFAEIGRACGRELSPAMICQAPTIAALAALVEAPASPRWSPIVLLKAGAEKPPVFLTYGIGGSLMDLVQLARCIPTAHPIYGMEAKGMDGVSQPLERVEDMAKSYLDAIRQIQAHGPYFLIGYSLGGLVMLEMAQRLSDAGEKVSLLAMLDSYPHIRYLPLAQRMRLMARRALRRATNMRQVLMRDSISEILRRRKQRLKSVPDRSQATSGTPSTAISFAEAAIQVRDKAVLALAHYQPRFYRGKINFVRAEIASYFPQDPAAFWAPLAAELEVETSSGDHVGMIATHFETLAPVLGRYLAEASSLGDRAPAVFISGPSPDNVDKNPQDRN
jgi:thioesterase domain-containing protein